MPADRYPCSLCSAPTGWSPTGWLGDAYIQAGRIGPLWVECVRCKDMIRTEAELCQKAGAITCGVPIEPMREPSPESQLLTPDDVKCEPPANRSRNPDPDFDCWECLHCGGLLRGDRVDLCPQRMAEALGLGDYDG